MEKILELKNITKIYPNGVVANRRVNLSIERNTIHAIVGENGAGKSTLMKVIFGYERPQEGEIYFKGKRVHIRSPYDAINLGIGMVHQHFTLAKNLTTWENLFLGIEPKKNGIFIDDREAIKKTKELSEKYGLRIPENEKILDLPLGVRQRVEILKLLLRNVEVLILDEPTSVLTPQETDLLFDVLRGLKKDGKTIIFISHKLKEVKEIADKITIMRDGTIVDTRDNKDLTEEEIAYLMVGRKISFEKFPPSPKKGEPILAVRNLNYTNSDGIPVLKNVSFEVRAGEIVGIAGIEGNGQTELEEILSGLRRGAKGEVLAFNENILNLSPREIRERGISLIPEDRMKHGVAEKAKISENLISDRYYKNPFSFGIRLNISYIREYSQELIKRFKIVVLSEKAEVSSLSGGNIQKVVVARELSSNPRIIISAQPTRGIDVGSEEFIHEELRKARDSGAGILLISADLEEVLKLSDRILVMYNGEIYAEFDNTEKLSPYDLSPYMLGLKRKEKA
ncbi:MAG: ABC transporter ATP-binding protein [Dictyoglomaceae bacterium]